MLNTTEVTPTMVRLLARSHEKMLDKLIFDPGQLADAGMLEALNTAAGRNYTEEWLNKGVDLEHQKRQISAVIRYCVLQNKAEPAFVTHRVINSVTNTASAAWKEPRINLYQAFVGAGRLEAAALIHLKSLEVSLLLNDYPELGYEQCQLVAEVWEQAFYRKLPEFAQGAASQFETFGIALAKAGKSLRAAISLTVPAQESANEPTA